MKFAPVEIIGLMAAFLTTGCYVPQAVKIIRTRDTHALSLVMYSFLSLGACLWVGYGVMIGSLSIILANVISFMLVALILALKIKHG